MTIRRSVTIAAPLAAVWDVLAQTSKINHTLGLPALVFSERARPDGEIEIVGTTKLLGMRVRWVEQPFEWVLHDYFQVERVFEGSPFIHSLTTGSRLQAVDDTATAVESFVTMLPRGAAGQLASRTIVGKMMQAQGRYLAQLAETFANRRTDYFAPARRVSFNAAALDELAGRLRPRPINPDLLARLLELIRTGRDEDVSAMRPFLLADEWGADRLEALRLFLYATQAGLLDLSWEVLCPNCRVSRGTTRTLRDLQETAHCEVCHIRYDVNFDEYVELRFAVNPTVRVAGNAMFCAIGSPGLNQHIVAQARLAPGAQRTLAVPIEPGGYRARMLGVEQRCQIYADASETDTAGALTLSDRGVQQTGLTCAPGTLTLGCTNASAREQLLIIERDAWGSARVSASLVTTLPEFRALFSSEVLAPGLGLAVKNLTILFSDIKNSTPMYEQWGDSSAFALVRDHFDVLFGAIERHEGAVVKTIGDAVMAVFANPAHAVAAALDMNNGIAVYNERHSDKPPLSIKVGLHTGPCIAVNANEVLDYFGTTVNAAARAQAVSVGDDIVLTADVMSAPGVAAILGQHRLDIEQFTRDLKGLSQAYLLFRLKPQSPLSP
ncbi:MAG TPA: adenylate/guanylate cyclase domain-containing protein [Herpetosiphonaceae bacterium]|nr:adenylate/guanylate cyclase domain-containing protein [Herpetosiphonaceae bacterium]